MKKILIILVLVFALAMTVSAKRMFEEQRGSIGLEIEFRPIEHVVSCNPYYGPYDVNEKIKDNRVFITGSYVARYSLNSHFVWITDFGLSFFSLNPDFQFGIAFKSFLGAGCVIDLNDLHIVLGVGCTPSFNIAKEKYSTFDLLPQNSKSVISMFGLGLVTGFEYDISDKMFIDLSGQLLARSWQYSFYEDINNKSVWVKEQINESRVISVRLGLGYKF